MSQPTERTYTVTFTTSATLTYTMFGDEMAEVMGGIPDDLAAALDKGGEIDGSVDVAALVDFLKRDGYGHFEQAVHVTQVHPSRRP